MGNLLALPTSIRLDWKCLPVTNTNSSWTCLYYVCFLTTQMKRPNKLERLYLACLSRLVVEPSESGTQIMGRSTSNWVSWKCLPVTNEKLIWPICKLHRKMFYNIGPYWQCYEPFSLSDQISWTHLF